LESGKNSRKQEFDFRCAADAPIQEHLGKLLESQSISECRVLDVGAGPLTSIGKTWKGLSIELTAVDPLAKEYTRLLQEHRVSPPVKTIEGHAETLDRQFPAGYFHLICSDNSLDHCFDPMRALGAMVEILAPGGCICLQHYINEGKEEGYDGFHQWNFFEESGRFWIANEKGDRHCVNEAFAGRVDVSCEAIRMLNKDWLRVILRKK
jgi:SAM-dependent methyltransferase